MPLLLQVHLGSNKTHPQTSHPHFHLSFLSWYLSLFHFSLYLCQSLYLAVILSQLCDISLPMAACRAIQMSLWSLRFSTSGSNGREKEMKIKYHLWMCCNAQVTNTVNVPPQQHMVGKSSTTQFNSVFIVRGSALLSYSKPNYFFCVLPKMALA